MCMDTLLLVRIVSALFMLSLLVWAISWIGLSSWKLYRRDEQRSFWTTSLLWNCINLLIAFYSLAVLRLGDYSLATARSQRSVVAINIFLDMLYLLVAWMLLRSVKQTYVQVGRAIAIQAVFLLVLDTLIVASLLILLKPGT